MLTFQIILNPRSKVLGILEYPTNSNCSKMSDKNHFIKILMGLELFERDLNRKFLPLKHFFKV